MATLYTGESISWKSKSPECQQKMHIKYKPYVHDQPLFFMNIAVHKQSLLVFLQTTGGIRLGEDIACNRVGIC